ncbi:MAG: hypothetical protein ACT4P1_00200 [Sporichthyaceae bacterium]
MNAVRTPALVSGRSPNVVLGSGLGLCYLAAGIAAVAVALGHAMGPGSGATDLAPAHVLAFFLVGALLVVAGTRGMAKVVNSVVGGCYLLAGVGLLFVARGHDQLLMLNEVENVLHLCAAALLLGIGRTQD